MGQRVKWSQLVNFYRVNANWMKYAFETKKTAQSEYNKFMSLNISNSQVYFTKAQASAGSCIVCPYIMTQGSLPSIEFTANNGSWSSNIYLPDGATLTSSTVVSLFSTQLKQANPAIREGDQISFIRLTQMNNGDTGYPYVIVRKYEFIVDSTSTALVGSYLPLDYIGVLNTGATPQLGVIDSGLSGGFLMILSRTQGGKTYVSSQSIIPVSMDAIIAQYSTDAQKAEAIASYGENADAFLSSTSADTNTQSDTPLSIIAIADDTHLFPPGFQVALSDYFHGGDEVSVKFNGSVGETNPTSVNFGTNKKSVTLQSPTVDGTQVTGNFPTSAAFDSDEYLAYVVVRFVGSVYQATFQVPHIRP